MPDDDPDLSKKVRQANNRLARHQKWSNIVLILLCLIKFALLLLVVSHLVDHPRAQ